MKKIIIALAVVCLSAATLSARPTGLNLGGGLAYEAFSFKSSLSGEKGLTDFLAAYAEVGYDWKLAKNCYIYVGGRYLEGFRSNGSGNAFETIGDIQVPIFYQQNFPVGKKKSKLFLEAGPTLDFWALNIYTEEVGGRIVTTNVFRNNPNAANRFNVYLGGNFGIKINMHAKIYVGGDYGMIDVNKASEIKSNRWQVKIGAAYIF